MPATEMDADEKRNKKTAGMPTCGSDLAQGPGGLQLSMKSSQSAYCPRGDMQQAAVHQDSRLGTRHRSIAPFAPTSIMPYSPTAASSSHSITQLGQAAMGRMICLRHR